MRTLLMCVLMAVVAGCSSQPTVPLEKREGCHTPLGFIPEGNTAAGYLHQVEQHGQACSRGLLTCQDGVWSGAYIYPTCVMTP